MKQEAEEKREDTPPHHSQSDSDNDDDMELDHETEEKGSDQKNGANGDITPQKSSAAKRDPSRPKRKKARRACFACQRAHLTCGDERPCQRCIKRGLASQCQDGMRKKAKYLHDAPNELLMPTYGGTYGQQKPEINGTNLQDQKTAIPPVQPPMQQGQFSPQGQQASMPQYRQPSSGPNQMRPLMPDGTQFQTYAAQTSPQAQNFGFSPISNMPNNMPPPPTPSEQSFGNSLFDSGDPSQYQFDLASMNFGNQYGAMEFGMLGHMAMGTNDNQIVQGPQQPPLVNTNFDGQQIGNLDFMNSPEQYSIHRHSSTATDWSNPHSALSRYPSNHDAPSAYVVGNTFSHTSPASSGPDNLTGFGSPSDRRGSIGGLSMASEDRYERTNEPSILPAPPAMEQPRRRQGSPKYNPDISKSIKQGSGIPKSKKRRDPSWIYDKITKPYPYTAAFHSLTTYLQHRFTPAKRLRIAKAMASVRPSFISLQRNLIDKDLVLMEQCFQRQLLEIEDIAEACGTPTIAIRRTGEVAYVGNEFVALTGWSRDVLLGRAPNLNVNPPPRTSASTPGSGGGSGTNSGGMTTPAIPARSEREPAKPQPVFFSELLDDDSAIQFFEDFAKLAFADSKGVGECRCTLLKYRTKETFLESATRGEADKAAENNKSHRRKSSIAGAEKVGDKEGKVECMYCWQVKRDVFEIPMMIVMNFLPIVT